MRIEDSIRRFIVDDLGWNGEDQLTDDYPLLGTGVLDSFGVVHVMSFLENEYAIQLFDKDEDLRNFGSIERIARLVESSIPAEGGPLVPGESRSGSPTPKEGSG